MSRDFLDVDRRGELPTDFAPEPEPEEPDEFDLESESVALIRRATYAFDATASGFEIVVLADGVDVSRMTSGSLVVLLHARSGFSATAYCLLSAYGVRTDEDDPGVMFVDRSRFLAGPLIVTGDTPSVLSCSVVPLLPPIGPQLQLQLAFVQGTTTAGVSQSITVSVYLIGRRGL